MVKKIVVEEQVKAHRQRYGKNKQWKRKNPYTRKKTRYKQSEKDLKQQYAQRSKRARTLDEKKTAKKVYKPEEEIITTNPEFDFRKADVKGIDTAKEQKTKNEKKETSEYMSINTYKKIDQQQDEIIEDIEYKKALQSVLTSELRIYKEKGLEDEADKLDDQWDEIEDKIDEQYDKIDELAKKREDVYFVDKSITEEEQEEIKEYAKKKGVRYYPRANVNPEIQKRKIDALADPSDPENIKLWLKKNRDGTYEPSDEFWNAWKEHKEEMKKNGIYVKKAEVVVGYGSPYYVEIYDKKKQQKKRKEFEQLMKKVDLKKGDKFTFDIVEIPENKRIKNEVVKVTDEAIVYMPERGGKRVISLYNRNHKLLKHVKKI
ncbi:MAG: hypothetical protein ACTSRR_09660 [Candidatus Heimdallarchaeaceae archaeon]